MIVAITGARGVVGSVLMARLADRHALIPVTRGEPLPGWRVADLSDQDALAAAFAGCDAVVHLAGAATLDASWPHVLDANIVGTYNVFEACRRAGVRRVVFASTNHVVGMFEVEADASLYDLEDTRSIDHLTEPRPDSLYGVSKLFGEDGPWAGLSAAPRRRLRATWLSHRDCAELVHRALVAPCAWAVVYGTSANHRRLWDQEHARRIIGYEPRDAAPIGLGAATMHEAAGQG